MKLALFCLCLLGLLTGLALWHQALLHSLTEQTEILLHKAWLSAENEDWQETAAFLDEAAALWRGQKRMLQIFGDHGFESRLNNGFMRAAAYAKQNSAPLFFGEASSLFCLLEEIAQTERPVLGNILRGFVRFPL